MFKVILGCIVAFVIFQACSRTSEYTSNSEGTAVSSTAPVEQLITGDERSSVVSALTKNLSLERDKIEKISFYSAKNPGIGKSRLEAYISLPDNSRPLLRVKPVYFGDDWVFYESIKVMVDDDVVYERDFSRANVVRDNSAGSVWETADFLASERDLLALRAIANAKSATIRFSGRDRRHDHEITAKERKDIKRILEAYEQLSNNLVRKPEKAKA